MPSQLASLEMRWLNYDERQLFAELIFRACCQRWVFATHPHAGCLTGGVKP